MKTYSYSKIRVRIKKRENARDPKMADGSECNWKENKLCVPQKLYFHVKQ